MKRRIQLLILLALLLLPLPGVFTPSVKAVDPITVSLLAPVALKVYEAAEPRLIRGARSGGRKIMQIGGNVFEILYLPLGAVQCTLGMPFGFFGSGVRNIGKGLVAPGKLVLNVLALPFALLGVDL